MNVFDLFAKLSLDSSEYDEGLNSAKNSANNFGKVAAGLGAGVATTVAAVSAAVISAGKAVYDNVSSVASAGDEIDKASQKLGINSDLYQKLAYAADLSGTSIDSFSLGIKSITASMGDLISGTEGAITGYDALNVSFTNIDGSMKSTEKVLMESLMALSDMEDETQRNALANEIFGRSYQELLPLLNSGSEGINAMMQEAEDYGMIMSSDVVSASAGFDDALTKLQGTIEGVKTGLLSDFLPSITTIMGALSDLFAGNEGAENKLVEGFVTASNSFDKLLSDLLNKINKVVPAIAKVAPMIIKSLLNGIIETLPELAPVALELIEELISTILEVLPNLLETGMQIIITLANGIAEVLPDLIPEVVETIIDLITTLLENADGIVDAALNIITGLVDGIITALPILVKALPQIILGIVNFFLSAIPQIVSTGVTLFMAIVEALPQIIIGIVKAIPEIITGIITALLNAIPELVVAGIELFIALISAMPEIIVEIVKAIPDIIKGIKDAFVKAWPDIKKAGKDMLEQITTGLAGSESLNKVAEKVRNIGDKIKTGFKDFINSALTWGKDLIDNFVSGITSKISNVTSTVSNVASTVKSYLGFSEPEEGPLSNFHTYAPDMMDLFSKGIYDNESTLTDAIEDVFDISDKIEPIDTSIVSSSDNGIANLLAEFLPQLANMKIVMDTGATVGQLAPSMDVALGKRLIASGRSV